MKTLLDLQGEIYIDLSEMEQLDKQYKIRTLIPFSQYYNEDDYAFQEDADGNPQLLIETEPFEQFVTDFMK